MRFIAVNQLADGAFAAAHLAGDRAEIVGGRLQIGGEFLQVLDDLAHVFAVLVDRAADRLRDAIDRCGELRNLGAQLFGNDARVQQRRVDVRAIRGDQRAHLIGDVARVLEDVGDSLLSLRTADRATQRGGDRFHVRRDVGDLARHVVDRRRRGAAQLNVVALRDRRVRRARIDLDVLLAEEAEVGDARGCIGAELHVVVELERHFRAAVRRRRNARDFAFAHAGDAHAGLLIESCDVVENRGELARLFTAETEVFDLQNEEAEDPENQQHECADLCCR